MTGQPGAVSAAVAGFAVSTTWERLPDETRTAVARVLARVLAGTRRGASAELTRTLAAYVLGLATPPHASLLAPGGAGRRVGAAPAALVNGAAAGLAVNGDIAVPVVAATLAAAEAESADGRTTLGALAAGMEVAARVTAGLGGTHAARGWDPVTTAGRIGGCVAAARVFGLDVAATVAALGYAATTAAGFRQRPGGTMRALGAGKAAADAVEAAQLARAGLIGPPAPLEGRRGMFALESGEDVTKVTDRLGERWLLSGHWPDATPTDEWRFMAEAIDSAAGEPAVLVAAVCR